jgi:hypothetical protein
LVSFSIEYPTSSVRVQYTTISVGVSSAPGKLSEPLREKLRAAAGKIQQITV